MSAMGILSILIPIIRLLFRCYTLMLFLRILLGWCPVRWQRSRFAYFLMFYTDPYLHIFRRILPPLGGVIDLSPILAFFILQVLEIGLIGILRWHF